MIKKALAVILGVVIVSGCFAQQHMPQRYSTYSDEAPATGFKKENLFLGGSLALGLGSYEFNVGVSPEIGYSLNKWLDAGVVLNFNYNSIRADPYYDNDYRYHIFNYGGGVFARAYVLPFLFLTAQPEYNWVSQNVKDMYPGSTDSYSYKTGAPSVLVGAGYGQRIIGQTSFYIALMFDAAGNVNSPYNDINGHPLPVVRAGFNFYLHQR